MTQFIAIIKTLKFRPPGGPVQELSMTSLEVVYADGRNCGVPLYVNGYEGAAGLLHEAGVSFRELSEKRPNFEKGDEVRIKLFAEDDTVEAMGFDPRLS